MSLLNPGKSLQRARSMPRLPRQIRPAAPGRGGRSLTRFVASYSPSLAVTPKWRAMGACRINAKPAPAARGAIGTGLILFCIVCAIEPTAPARAGMLQFASPWDASTTGAKAAGCALRVARPANFKRSCMAKRNRLTTISMARIESDAHRQRPIQTLSNYREGKFNHGKLPHT